MQKTKNNSIAILISGYHNDRGFSDIISCSDSALEQEIRDKQLVIKDFRYSLNIIAESEIIYSIGFAKNWKIYSIYEAYGWSARKVIIGLSLFMKKDCSLSGTHKHNVTELLAKLKQEYIKIDNYQLQTVLPLSAESVKDIEFESGTASNSSYHLEQYRRKEEQGIGVYEYQKQSEPNAIFSENYAPELQGYREVYLISSDVKYIKSKLKLLPTITPKPISKDIKVKFVKDGIEIPFSKITGVVHVNNQKHYSDNIPYTISENNSNFTVRIDDQKYELKGKSPYHVSTRTLLEDNQDIVQVELKDILYKYTIECKNSSTNKPIEGMEINYKYGLAGQELEKKTATNNTGQIYISGLRYGDNLIIESVKYEKKDKEFPELKDFGRITEKVYESKKIPLTFKQKAVPKPTQKKDENNSTSPKQPNSKDDFSGSQHKRNQNHAPSAKGGIITYFFEPEEAKPKKENIELKYVYDGKEFLFNPHQYRIDDDNHLYLDIDTTDYDKIILNIVKGKNYTLTQAHEIDNQKIRKYASSDNKMKFTIELEKKTNWKDFFKTKLGKILMIVGGVLILATLVVFIIRSVKTPDDIDLQKLVTTSKTKYKERINKLSEDFDADTVEIFDLLRSLNLESSANADTIKGYETKIKEQKTSFSDHKNKITTLVNKLNETNLADTTTITNEMILTRKTAHLLDAIRQDMDNYKLTINQTKKKEENEAKAAAKVKKDNLKTDFETYRTFMYGSLDNIKHLKNYAEKLKKNEQKYIDAGVDPKRVALTVALADNRVKVRDYRFHVLCFLGKVECKAHTKDRISNEDFDEKLDFLKLLASSNNQTLTKKQVQELKHWLKSNGYSK